MKLYPYIFDASYQASKTATCEIRLSRFSALLMSRFEFTLNQMLTVYKVASSLIQRSNTLGFAPFDFNPKFTT